MLKRFLRYKPHTFGNVKIINLTIKPPIFCSVQGEKHSHSGAMARLFNIEQDKIVKVTGSINYCNIPQKQITMKRLGQTLLLALLTIFLHISPAQAQVEEIKEGLEGVGETLSGGGSGINFVFDIFLDFFLFGYDYHIHQLNRKPEIPEVISLELMPHIGFGKNASIFIAPRVRGNWGLLSTDFRYSRLAADGNLATLDWQILNLNVVNEKAATLRIGTGFMHEYYLGSTFNEHLFGLDIRWDKERRIKSTVEFRIARDYGDFITRRTEFNARLNYKVIDLGRIHGHLNAGFIYQRWNEQTNVWIVQSGMNFNLF